jgi:hypothetical protein
MCRRRSAKQQGPPFRDIEDDERFVRHQADDTGFVFSNAHARPNTGGHIAVPGKQMPVALGRSSLIIHVFHIIVAIVWGQSSAGYHCATREQSM